MTFPHFLLSFPLTPSWFLHRHSSKTAGTRSPVTNVLLNARGTLRSTHCLTSQEYFTLDGHFLLFPLPRLSGHPTLQVFFLSFKHLSKPLFLLSPHLKCWSSSELCSRPSLDSLYNHTHSHILNPCLHTNAFKICISFRTLLTPSKYTNIYLTSPVEASQKIQNQCVQNCTHSFGLPLPALLISVRVLQSTLLLKGEKTKQNR